MSLHAKIMALRNAAESRNSEWECGVIEGHESAIQKAAELAAQHDAVMEQMAKALRECADRLEPHIEHTEDLIAHMQAHRAIEAHAEVTNERP